MGSPQRRDKNHIAAGRGTLSLSNGRQIEHVETQWVGGSGNAACRLKKKTARVPPNRSLRLCFSVSPYVNAKLHRPLKSRSALQLCTHAVVSQLWEERKSVISVESVPKNSSTQTHLSRQVLSANLCLAFRQQPRFSICCVHERPSFVYLPSFYHFGQLPETRKNSITWWLGPWHGRFYFNHPKSGIKRCGEVVLLLRACVCAGNGQWAVHWHRQAHWDQAVEILILVALYENVGHTWWGSMDTGIRQFFLIGCLRNLTSCKRMEKIYHKN